MIGALESQKKENTHKTLYDILLLTLVRLGLLKVVFSVNPFPPFSYLEKN